MNFMPTTYGTRIRPHAASGVVCACREWLSSERSAPSLSKTLTLCRVVMSDEEKDKPPESKPAKHVRVGPLEAEDPTVEWDPDDRFHRSDEEIAKGRFKTVYRGYDTENGIDVAWCKVEDPDPEYGQETLERIYKEMKKGLSLDHSSIIRCFACWLDTERGCINLITELFTSGTLRSYIEKYNVEMNVHRKVVRQILNGLKYLHAHIPPVVHADLRLDKIYVNGFNGEVKIGDLGLTTLQARRYHPSEPPEFDSPLEDLFSLGLCVYELLTGTQLDRVQLADPDSEGPLLQNVRNPDARDFISQCLEMDSNLTADALLGHQFLKKQSSFKVKNGGEWDIGRVDSQTQSISTKLRGEDYNFDLQVCLSACSFFYFLMQGYESDSDERWLHIRLVMSNEAETEHVKILDFDYSLETDTPDSVGAEIADKFQLSSTDRELCKAALKEWLSVMAASKRDAPSPLH